jgi:F-type H+/Na+-transporting ATPase subunit alpha
VVEAGDGIARVEGLPRRWPTSCWSSTGGIQGLALNLDVREIGVVVLGDFSRIEEGQRSAAPARCCRSRSATASSAGSSTRWATRSTARPDPRRGRRALELQAPTVVQRQPVKEPLQTGIKAIDAMTPIGRGQRQLIIGDRQTGKTAVAIDTIINQRTTGSPATRASRSAASTSRIGQKGSTIAGVRGALEEAGAMEYTTIVAAPASDPAGFKYLAPYTGSAIGQHWMYEGKHVLIVFDDLSKQAEAYRSVSLLLRRPPGREAYPGDVFYLHSRLLERCAKLSDELGGGSMTGLPIIETKANDVSAYIPTNVISITDGQCFLESDLFNSGVRPAINVGISVSRVGGAAQVKAMKKVAGSLRWTWPSSASSRRSRLRLRPRQGLAGPAGPRRPAGRAAQAAAVPPYPVEEQVVSIWTGTSGQLDEVPVEDVRRFEAEFLDYLARERADIMADIADTNDLPDASAKGLQDALDSFKGQFVTSSGQPLVKDEPVGALEEEADALAVTRVVRKTPAPGTAGTTA